MTYDYRTERTLAQNTLEKLVKRLRGDMRDRLEKNYVDDRLRELAAVYVPAQIALLDLLREEREEQHHERTA